MLNTSKYVVVSQLNSLSIINIKIHQVRHFSHLFLFMHIRMDNNISYFPISTRNFFITNIININNFTFALLCLLKILHSLIGENRYCILQNVLKIDCLLTNFNLLYQFRFLRTKSNNSLHFTSPK